MSCVRFCRSNRRCRPVVDTRIDCAARDEDEQMRLTSDRILLIGDIDRQLQGAVMRVLPSAKVTSIPGMFDGIAELANNRYSTVLPGAGPIGRRPEAAVK